MAAPSYTTDLTNIELSEVIGTWVETGTWTAGANPIIEPDFFIQGQNCVAKYMTTGGVGLGGFVMNFGSGINIPLNGAVLTWMMQQCPNNIDTEASGGMRVIIGSSATAFNAWTVKGKDTYSYGGWNCFAVNPSINNGVADYTIGAPTATKQWFGGAINQLANAKGGTGIDAIRYGRCEARINGGETGNYATFSGYAAVNDTSQNRWGLIQAIDGGYLQQGLVTLGYTSAVTFIDSNTSILIANTKKVLPSFNSYEIRQASSLVNWSNISFSALGTVSRGKFECIDDASVNITSCVFTGMDTFIFKSKSVLTSSTFRRCNQVTQGRSTFTNCTFSNASTGTSFLVNNLALVSGCKFESNGMNHAMQLTSDCSGGTYSLSGFSFTSYATVDGSTGNEALYNNSSGLVTLSVLSGDTPSVRNGTNATTTFASSSTLTMTVTNEAGNPIQGILTFIDNVDPSVAPPFIMNSSTNESGIASVVWTGGAVATATWRARKYGYKPFVALSSIPATGAKDIPVTMIADPQQI